MTKLIRLLPDQKNAVRVIPPFKLPARVEKEELEGLVNSLLEGSKEARERLILGNVYLVLNLVGRYLHYWKQTARFEEDMVSEGIMSLIETINSIEDVSEYKWLVYRILYRAKYAVEKMLNENQVLVAAPFKTNRKRISQGLEPIFYNEVPIKATDASYEDEGQYIVDIIDTFEMIQNTDTEELYDLVLDALATEHNILADDITPGQLNKLREIIRITKGEL